MSNGAGVWLKGILVTSPILLAAAASVFLVASSIINPPEPEFVFTPPQDPAQQAGSTKIEMTAEDIYLDFLQDPEESNNQYLDKQIKITGTVASWGFDKDLLPVLSLISDSFGNDKIICRWYQFFNEEGMIDIIGKEIVLLGTCNGLTDDLLYFNNCSSEVIPTRIPAELLD